MNEEKNTQESLKGFPITFNIYARNTQEIEDLRMVIIAFISAHAHQGRAIDAVRLAKAIANWDQNPIVKNQIINYFK